MDRFSNTTLHTTWDTLPSDSFLQNYVYKVTNILVHKYISRIYLTEGFLEIQLLIYL